MTRQGSMILFMRAQHGCRCRFGFGYGWPLKVMVFLAAVLAACGEQDEPRCARGGAPCEPSGERGPEVLFDPLSDTSEELWTYPTDLLTEPDADSETGLRLHLQRYSYAFELDRLDGFGTFAPLTVALEGQLDEAALAEAAELSVTGQGPVLLLHTDNLAGSDGQDLTDRLVPVHLSFHSTDRLLFVSPEEPLAEAASYALVVTRCLQGADGRGASPSDRFTKLAVGCPEGYPSTYCDRVHEVLGYLAQPSVCLHRDDLALVQSFTTRSVGSWFDAMEGWVAALPAVEPQIETVLPATDATGNLHPSLLARFPGMAEELSDIDISAYPMDGIGQVVVGSLPSWVLYDPETGVPLRDPVTGAPAPTQQAQLEFIVALPSTPVAGGAPLVLFVHGFTYCKETLIALAGTFGRAGLALAGIDIVNHGSRSSGGPGACRTDAFEFVDLSHFQVSTARFEQTVADLLQFSHFLKQAELDLAPADGQPDLDPTRLGFVGESVGAFMGADFVAHEPDIGAAVINVGGGGVSQFFIASMLGNTLGRPEYAELPSGFWELFLTFQTVAEGADPLNHLAGLGARDPMGARNLLLQEAFEDEVVPNWNTELLARLLGLPHVTPSSDPAPGLARVDAPLEGNLAGGRTGGMYRFTPAQHAFLLLDDPENAPGATFRGQIQAAVFLQTAFDTGSAVIIDPTDPAQIAEYAPFWTDPVP